MTGVKHTPGPWKAHKTIEAHDGMPECWQIDAEYDAVCTTQFCYAPNTEANARLIAAAPDLLETGAELQAARKIQNADPSAANALRVRRKRRL